VLQPARHQTEIVAAALTPTALRLQLWANGYAPLPIEGKRPPLKDWQKKTTTNAQEIELWENTYPQATNTGILTQLTPTLDIDITNPEAAEAVEALARERFEERGFMLVRIGQAPKRAILLRTNTPLKKLPALSSRLTATLVKRSNYWRTDSRLLSSAPIRRPGNPTHGLAAASQPRSSMTSSPMSARMRPSNLSRRQ